MGCSCTDSRGLRNLRLVDILAALGFDFDLPVAVAELAQSGQAVSASPVPRSGSIRTRKPRRWRRESRDFLHLRVPDRERALSRRRSTCSTTPSRRPSSARRFSPLSGAGRRPRGDSGRRTSARRPANGPRCAAVAGTRRPHRPGEPLRCRSHCRRRTAVGLFRGRPSRP